MLTLFEGVEIDGRELKGLLTEVGKSTAADTKAAGADVNKDLKGKHVKEYSYQKLVDTYMVHLHKVAEARLAKEKKVCTCMQWMHLHMCSHTRRVARARARGIWHGPVARA